MRRAAWVIFGTLSIVIGFYPVLYFLNDGPYGLLESKSAALLSNHFYNLTFYGHIALGGLALLIGWMQFSGPLRRRSIRLHRTIGKTYVLAVLISGICGAYIALHATGGIICVVGFASLALIWLLTTVLGFDAIRKQNIKLHQEFMIYSYAACFGAVTLRIWLPLLEILTGSFIDAYRIVSWLAWIPNLIVAHLIISKKKLEFSIMPEQVR